MSIGTILESFNDSQIKAIIEIDDNLIDTVLSLTDDEIQEKKTKNINARAEIDQLLETLSDDQLRSIKLLAKVNLLGLIALCKQQVLIKEMQSSKISLRFKELAQLFLPILTLKDKLDLELHEGFRITDEPESKRIKLDSNEIKPIGADDAVAYYTHPASNGLEALVSSLSPDNKVLLFELMKMEEKELGNEIYDNLIGIFPGGSMQYPLNGCLSMLLYNKQTIKAQLEKELQLLPIYNTYITYSNMLDNYIYDIRKNTDYPLETRKEKLKVAYTAKANLTGVDAKFTLGKMSFMAKTRTANNNVDGRIERFEKTMISAELKLINEYITHQQENTPVEYRNRTEKVKIALQAKANLIGKDVETKKTTTGDLNVFDRIGAYERTLIENKQTLSKEENPKLFTIISRIFERITGLFIYKNNLLKPGLSEGHGEKLVKRVERKQSQTLAKQGHFAISNNAAASPDSNPAPIADPDSNDASGNMNNIPAHPSKQPI